MDWRDAAAGSDFRPTAMGGAGGAERERRETEYAKLPLIPSYFEIERNGFVDGVNFASSICRCLVETNRGLEVYRRGGRKFAIFTLVPLGCFPSARAFVLQQNKTDDCFEELNELLKLHNLILPKMLKQLQKELKGFMYTLFDLYKVVDQRVNNPSKYGFEVSKMACCGTGPFRGINSCGGRREVKDYQLCQNPKDYVFFDSSHPSESPYKQSAELLWHGDPDVTGPHSLKSFFELSG
ncbi:PREDICTED: GDSL esterase/lipase 4-like [Nicotiana attenuata]|uniref:GDSL esterase/lipase 4-like n=1 Tax=Nicotiana attenuata TaxID=49451 RepID=UPI0009048662|nr:PREDICTED: GDSL esterase/lipase 4-like [Nicotiana attenuata]